MSNKTMPFRQWYANIVELKSLLHDSTCFAIFTATATKATKNAIYQMLNLNALSTFAMEKPPLRWLDIVMLANKDGMRQI